jgi:hypothetical protein
MNEFLFHFGIVAFPLIISNTLHMLVVKYNVLLWFRKPIWEKGFGKNKTVRGFVVLPILNGVVLYLQNMVFEIELTYPFILGLTLGLTYMLFELPNSYLKRKLNIEEGKHNTKYKFLFILLDKSDSAFGVNLVYYLFSDIDVELAILLFVASVAIHLSVSMFLYKIKLKSAL